MLTELLIRQFALMEEVRVDFTGGMTVFTGETGAGKSILVDALGAAFGTRARADWVRHGAKQAEISATLESDDPRLAALLQEQGIEPEAQLLLRRIIDADGRSKAYVNGVPSPMRLLQQIGDLCLDLHGQHEHQALHQSDFQRNIIDAGVAPAMIEVVSQAYAVWRKAKKALEALSSERGDTEQQEAWMREELKRLQALAPEVGLEDKLQTEVDAARHFAQIQSAAAAAIELLDAGEHNVRELLGRAAHGVDAVAEFHPSLREGSSLFAQIDALLGELEPTLRDALDIEFDPESLQQTENRLADLREAMRRHHTDEAGLLALMQEWEEKLSLLETAEWDEETLSKALYEAREKYLDAAGALSEARQQSGKALVANLRPFLDKLGLAGMQIEVDVEALSDDESAWVATGFDRLQFLAASNPGEPFRALSAIASGGELSRFVLALKGCGALANAPHIAVFDEVDVGIGGETAWCVGELLAAMGRERQVFVVSHLPQVASCADHQVCIRKAQDDSRTKTLLEKADGDEARLHEIARMLGGKNEESLRHAAQMLERGKAC